MNKKLVITLRSDLCAAVGKHYAAMIDIDTALEENGLPYIPARRLKGCLRELAEYCCPSDRLDALFGVAGDKKSGALFIGNARVSCAERVTGELSVEEADAVTELYCDTRGQTAIENDTVKEGSLRFVRVVGRLDPLTGEPLRFSAPVSFPDEYEPEMRRIVSGLRNIGYHRNRGLGAVSCSLEDAAEESPCVPDGAALKDDVRYGMRLTVRLDGDLMLPQTGTGDGTDYIPGTAVLGAFAAKYDGDEDFNTFFLSDGVSFGSLYPAMPRAKGGYDFTEPAYRFLGKVKGAATAEEAGVKNMLALPGNIRCKPLKDGFIGPCGYVHPQMKTVYHNAHPGSPAEQLLYMQYCLCAGGYYSGTVIADGKRMKTLLRLLADGRLRFGRSKTAQYGACTVTECVVSPFRTEKASLRAGQLAAAVCVGDVLLQDENGNDCATAEALAAALGIKEVPRVESSISVRNIGGFNAKWNLNKPMRAVIGAGSCLVFEPVADATVDELAFIGEKQNEGFGRVRFIADAAAFAVPQSGTGAHGGTVSDAALAAALAKEKRRTAIIDRAYANAKKLELEAAQNGRLTRMVKESKTVEDLEKRIGSIKTGKTKEKATKFFFPNGQPVYAEWDDMRLYCLTALTAKKYDMKTDKGGASK